MSCGEWQQGRDDWHDGQQGSDDWHDGQQGNDFQGWASGDSDQQAREVAHDELFRTLTARIDTLLAQIDSQLAQIDSQKMQLALTNELHNKRAAEVEKTNMRLMIFQKRLLATIARMDRTLKINKHQREAGRRLTYCLNLKRTKGDIKKHCMKRDKKDDAKKKDGKNNGKKKKDGASDSD